MNNTLTITSPEVICLAERLRQKIGLRKRTEAAHLAIRDLAKREGIAVDPEPSRSSVNGVDGPSSPEGADVARQPNRAA